MSTTKKRKLTRDEKRWILVEHLITKCGFVPHEERINDLTKGVGEGALDRMTWGKFGNSFYLSSPDKRFTIVIGTTAVQIRTGVQGRKFGIYPIGGIELIEDGIRYGIISIKLTENTLGKPEDNIDTYSYVLEKDEGE